MIVFQTGTYNFIPLYFFLQRKSNKVSSTTTMSKPILYSYFRSSCSWRVRTVLALKNIDYEYVNVNLLKGEQKEEEYRKLNPQGLVPALVVNGVALGQSLAIIEYLEEVYPETPLLPKDPLDRAKVRQLSDIIACDTQPVQNLRVLRYMEEEKRPEWGNYWITKGLEALEAALKPVAGRYCFGDAVTMADVCLIPQLYNARRFKVDMDQFPIISRIEAELNQLEPFVASHPSAQPDCPEDLK